MTVGSKSWREFIQYKTTIIASGFISIVMWPLYFTSMHLQLNLFKYGDIALSEENPIWMRCIDIVQTEVLSLPPEIYRQPQRRHTIYGNNWLLSR